MIDARLAYRQMSRTAYVANERHCDLAHTPKVTHFTLLEGSRWAFVGDRPRAQSRNP